MEDSLGGNCITTFMGMISPGQENFLESFSTLKFAHRTKKIKNKPKINEELDQETLILKYQNELKRLRELMTGKNKGMGHSRLVQLEEAKIRAEHDKDLMMQRLQEQSQKFLEEREEKKILKIQITHLETKLDMYQQFKKEFKGGKGSDNDWTGECETEKAETRMRKVDNQLKLLEEQKAHVDQYKDLLLRQRDIMVALTSKLNERDEAIVQLQDELEAYDKIYIECENLLRFKSSQLEFVKSKLEQNGIDPKEMLGEFEDQTIDQERDFKDIYSKESKRTSERYAHVDVKEDVIQTNLKHLVFKETSQEEKLGFSGTPFNNCTLN